MQTTLHLVGKLPEYVVDSMFGPSVGTLLPAPLKIRERLFTIDCLLQTKSVTQ